MLLSFQKNKQEEEVSVSLDPIVSITLIFGIVLGASILIVAIVISLIKSEMSTGGAGFCLIGAILLGMSI